MNFLTAIPLRTSASPRPLRLISSLVILIPVLLNSKANAQFTDEVVVKGSTAGSRMTIRCEIVDYTGRYLTARGNSGQREQRIPSEQVLTVRTPQTETHKLGKRMLDEGRLREAETHLTKALEDEPRTWMRREILALLTRSALRRNDLTAAGTRFQMLFTSDPDTPYMDLVPLQWTAATVQGEARSSAIVWLKDPEPIARLIGASLLFFDPSTGQVARDVLSKLNRTPGDRIRRLAWWQQWRLRIHTRDVTEYDIERWTSRVEDLEPALRAGPYFLLGEGFLIRQDFEMAAANFLKVPLVHESDHPIVPRSLLHAGNSLARIGLTDQAAGLYDELLNKYSHAPTAPDAKRELERLQKSD